MAAGQWLLLSQSGLLPLATDNHADELSSCPSPSAGDGPPLPPPAPAPPPGGVSFLQQERVRPTPIQRTINHTTAARAFVVSSPLLLSCGLAVAPEAAPGLLAVDVHDRCSWEMIASASSTRWAMLSRDAFSTSPRESHHDRSSFRLLTALEYLSTCFYKQAKLSVRRYYLGECLD